MNGVIHNCSHGAGTDINTRMGEVRRALGSARRARAHDAADERTLEN
jgi:hypothetical protein